MPIKKDIIYPVFLECCQYAIDNFWVNMFEDLAYGKTPYGTYISKNFFCCNYKNKEFSYKIERKESNVLYTDIYNLLTKNLGILSRQEKVKKRFDFHKLQTKIKDTRQEWANIRRKNIKDLLVERYVIDMKNTYSLSLKQSKYLLSIIFIALIFKVFTSKDIEYGDGKIKSISGIEFTNKNILIKRGIYDIDVNISEEMFEDKKIMKDNWEKYLSSIKKQKS